MVDVNATDIQGTFVVIKVEDNCTNQLKPVLKNSIFLVLFSIQFMIHLLSFILAMIAFFVVKYYSIAGRRMNHMLLLLTLMEIVYNLSSVGNYLARLPPSKNLMFNIYVEIIFTLLSNETTILNRNWWTALIAIARYLVVYRPLGKCHLRITHSNISFGVISFLGVLYTLVFTLWFRIIVRMCLRSQSSSLHIWDVHGTSISYRVADALTVCLKSLFPLFIVIIFSILTYNIVRKTPIAQRSSGLKGLSSMRTSKTLLLICLLFTICQLPYAMTIIFCFVEKKPILDLYKIIKRLSLILVAINSLGNVAIYFVRSKDFREALRDMRHCKFNFVELRKATQRQKYLSYSNLHSFTRDKEERSTNLEEEL